MLDVSEELTFTTECRGRGLNRRLFSPWASSLPLNKQVCLNHKKLNTECIYLKGFTKMHETKPTNLATYQFHMLFPLQNDNYFKYMSYYVKPFFQQENNF